MGSSRPRLRVNFHICASRGTRNLHSALVLVAALVTAAALTACRPEPEAPAPEARPVRTVTVVKREIGETVAFTGRIEAENETRFAFRISGRMTERSGFDKLNTQIHAS